MANASHLWENLEIYSNILIGVPKILPTCFVLGLKNSNRPYIVYLIECFCYLPIIIVTLYI